MRQQCCIGWRCCMVKLIDDDHIKVIGIQQGQVHARQTLHRCKYVLVALGSSTIDPQLAKRCITQGVLECDLGLRQYFLPMCDKKQASAAQSLLQARIVDSCHDCHACTRCRHQ